MDGLGGAEQVLKMIARFHRNDAVYIYFLCEGKESQLWMDNEFRCSYAGTDNRIIAIYQFIRYIQRNKNITWDLLLSSHTNITGILGIIIRIGILRKKKFIARESTAVFQRFSGIKLFQYKMMYKLGYNSVDLLICQTNDMKMKLLNAAPFLSKKTHTVTIKNPIDLSLLKQTNKSVPYSKYIVSAGRFIDAKAFDVLIKAFQVISKSFNDYKLVILGDGELKNQIIAQCKELGVYSSVKMPGHVDNVLPYFKNAEVCVVSSRIEGFPNVLLQMMSQNTNVVSTLCAGGIAELEGVLTVETENHLVLAEAIMASIESKSVNNRVLFDKELAERDISKFMKELEGHCNYSTRCTNFA